MMYQQLFALFFIGVIFYSAVKSVKGLRKIISLRKSGVSAVATIVGFDTEKDSDGTQYFPIVRFLTISGEMEVKINEARTLEPKIGKEVGVFYDAINPREVTIDNKWMLLFHVIAIISEAYIIFFFTYFLINHKWLY